MKTILYSIILLPLFTNFILAQDSTFNYPSRSNIQSEIKNSIVKIDSIFRYKYSLINDAESEQDIQEFYVEFFAKIINTSNPENWISLVSKKTLPVVIWESNNKMHDLKPNYELDGFFFESLGFPKIINYYIAGYVDEPEFNEGDAPPYKATTGLNVFKNSLKGITLGPWLPDSSISLEAFTDTLQTFHSRSCEELGWITNKGICNSLEVKIRNVKRHLERGKAKQAGNVLNAFLSEVQAQRGKHITEEGYALLYYNAQYLQQRINELE